LTVTVQRPLFVEGGFAGRGLGPVIHLHDPRVHFQPVADLVLGRKDRPVFRKIEIGQVIVPDRIVQAERLVAPAPLVAGPLVAVDHDMRDAQLPHPRAQRDAALPPPMIST
jgi:hypothetical protein